MVCAELAEQLGLLRSEFTRLLEARPTRDLLTENAREAHRRGAFGVPTFFLGDVMYWGNDRLILLEYALREK